MPSIKTITLATLTTLAAATPMTITSRNAPHDTLLPKTYSQWSPSSSSISYNTSYGQVQRTTGYGNDISTLLSFNIPASYSTRQCELIFTNPTNVGGSAQAQVFFDTRAAAPGATSDFRDNQIGNLVAVAGGVATFSAPDGSNSQAGLPIACSRLIAEPNLEIVPRGDQSYIYWTQGNGLQVLVY